MWSGFDGRAYTRAQWVAHVAQTPIFPSAKMIVEHSTGVPTLAQWLTFNEANYRDCGLTVIYQIVSMDSEIISEPTNSEELQYVNQKIIVDLKE